MSYSRNRGGRWGMNFLAAGSSANDTNKNSSSKTQIVHGGKAAVPPPSSFALRNESQGYTDTSKLVYGSGTLMSGGIGTNAASASTGTRAFSNLGKRRIQEEDDYFNDDDDGTLEYQPAPGSPAAAGHAVNEDSQSDDSDDPLEKFMAGVEAEVHDLVESDTKKAKCTKKRDDKGIRDDIEQEDNVESYLRFMEENPHIGLTGDEEEIYEYDAEGNIIAAEKKAIDPLPPIDHSVIKYPPFTKNFYVEHPDISQLSTVGVADLLGKLGLRVSGPSPPRPVCSFAHLGMDEPLMEAIRKAGYTQPTPIQAQAVPVALSGRDLIGIAKTGSGKTAAFLWPMIVHIMDQPELGFGDGPIGLVCAPTRELSQQIYSEAKKLARVYNLTVVCAYGGGSLWEQQKACEAGCEILICTPGRIIDLVKKKSTNLRRTTYVVFDEADKMFNLGFEPQVRSIADHIRPDRQTLLFSATFKKRVERLARDILTDPIRIIQGELGEANEDITQIVEIFSSLDDKFAWIFKHLVQLTTEGSVLIFVTRKTHSEEVAQRLKARDFKVLLIHGDMHQSDRNTVIQAFKRQEAPILVATDVASRGLDIPSIHNVVNFEVARDIDTHTHRVGRTGRAGQKGTAYTLFLRGRDANDFAAHLVCHLELASQHVSADLLEIALTCPWFSQNRTASNGAWVGLGGTGAAKAPRGFVPRAPRERPGLGSSGQILVRQEGPAAAAVAGAGEEIIRPGGYGPQSDRLGAMKAAFSAQYNRHFVSAGVEKTKYLHPELVGAARSASQAAGSVLQSISGSTSNGRDQKDGIDSVDNISESGSTDMLGTFVAPIPPAIPANSAPTLNNTYPSQSHSSSSSTEAKRKRSRWD